MSAAPVDVLKGCPQKLGRAGGQALSSISNTRVIKIVALLCTPPASAAAPDTSEGGGVLHASESLDCSQSQAVSRTAAQDAWEAPRLTGPCQGCDGIVKGISPRCRRDNAMLWP